jgi:hypothetical protein
VPPPKPKTAKDIAKAREANLKQKAALEAKLASSTNARAKAARAKGTLDDAAADAKRKAAAAAEAITILKVQTASSTQSAKAEAAALGPAVAKKYGVLLESADKAALKAEKAATDLKASLSGVINIPKAEPAPAPKPKAPLDATAKAKAQREAERAADKAKEKAKKAEEAKQRALKKIGAADAEAKAKRAAHAKLSKEADKAAADAAKKAATITTTASASVEKRLKAAEGALAAVRARSPPAPSPPLRSRPAPTCAHFAARDARPSAVSVCTQCLHGLSLGSVLSPPVGSCSRAVLSASFTHLSLSLAILPLPSCPCSSCVTGAQG